MNRNTPLPAMERTAIDSTRIDGNDHEKILQRALIAGDRETSYHAARQLLDLLERNDPIEHFVWCLSIVTSAEADASGVVDMAGLEAWAERVSAIAMTIPVHTAVPSLEVANKTSNARQVVRSKARECVEIIRDQLRGAWVEPGQLVRFICDLGEMHLAHQVAALMCAHGDGAASLNVRSAKIRRLVTSEAVRLTAITVEKNPNHYHFNPHTAALMDQFMLTGELDAFLRATRSIGESLRTTPDEAKPLSYTCATLSRVVRVVAEEPALRMMNLAGLLREQGSHSIQSAWSEVEEVPRKVKMNDLAVVARRRRQEVKSAGAAERELVASPF